MFAIEENVDVKFVEKNWTNRNKIFIEEQVKLSDNVSIDSAGLAFFVLWSKELGQKKLQIIGAPRELVKLVDTFKVTDLFVIQ